MSGPRTIGHLGAFQFFAIISSAVINVPRQNPFAHLNSPQVDSLGQRLCQFTVL